MPRIKKTPFAQWETTKVDGFEKRFIRMGDTQMLHPAVLSLNHTAYRVYTYMKLESGGKPVFEFPRLKWKSFVSPGGFQKAKKELCKAGLIEVAQSNANLRKANVYRFSAVWKAAK